MNLLKNKTKIDSERVHHGEKNRNVAGRGKIEKKYGKKHKNKG